MTATPKIGLFLPVDWPWAKLRDLAERAEAVGFDSVWVMDHLLFRRSSGTTGVWECFSLASAIAAVTRRVEIGTLVACTAFRSPTMLAKIADTVDDVSGGRLILGLGAGWHEPEFEALGVSFDHRASKFEEAFTIVAALLREGKADFAGRFYQAKEVVLLPRGPRPQGPPILVGTGGERLLRFTAQHADLWNTCWYDDPAKADAALAKMDAACRDVGRDPKAIGRTAGVTIRDEVLSSPQRIADLARAFHAKGFEHVQLRKDGDEANLLDGVAPALELLKKG